MLNAATVAVERFNLIERAELALQSMFRALRKPQLEKMHEFSLPPTSERSTDWPGAGSNPEPDSILEPERSDSDILEVHRAAAVKVDAAEYALTMMLTELREVMVEPPTLWQPARTPPTDDRQPAADYMVRAA